MAAPRDKSNKCKSYLARSNFRAIAANEQIIVRSERYAEHVSRSSKRISSARPRSNPCLRDARAINEADASFPSSRRSPSESQNDQGPRVWARLLDGPSSWQALGVDRPCQKTSSLLLVSRDSDRKRRGYGAWKSRLMRVRSVKSWVNSGKFA